MSICIEGAILNAIWRGFRISPKIALLIIGEFGMDTRAHSEGRNEMLGWHIERGRRQRRLEPFCIPGRTNGGVTDGTSLIGLGLTTRERKPKPALTTVKALFNSDESMTLKVKLPRYPKGVRDCLLI